MRLHVLIALSIGSALAYGATAFAQQPAPSASPPPAAAAAPPDYGPPITNDQAKAAAAAAFAEAKKNNWRMAFAIVGPAGELVYFERMDGTQMASGEIAQGKARTAAMFRRPSKVFADQYAAGNTAFTTFPEKPVAAFRLPSTARSSARSVRAAVLDSRTVRRRPRASARSSDRRGRRYERPADSLVRPGTRVGRSLLPGRRRGARGRLNYTRVSIFLSGFGRLTSHKISASRIPLLAVRV